MALTIRELGVIVRARRMEFGLSQADLARDLGVSRWWVIQLEAGQAPGAGLASVLAALDRLGLAFELAATGEAEATHGTSSDLDAIIEEHRG